jgi:microcystin-dependent protein
MPEPNEPIKGLTIPNTGDLVGAWGTSAMNPNFTAIGGMLGGFQTISLSAATTIALTGPSGSITPGAGPTQQQNALLRFTGAQTGTATIQFSLPGRYVIDHQASTAFPIVLAPASGTGTQIGAPWWRKCAIFFDGTNVDYENPPEPGSAIDLHMSSIPNWMLVCTKQYALVKDGSTYSTANYSGLANVLGSTFGGNGVTTFAVPDERSRMRLPIDTNGPGSFSNRVTAAVSGVNGTTMGASGGDQNVGAHAHSASASVTDPGHAHTASIWNTNAIAGQFGGGYSQNFGAATTNAATTGISVGVTVATGGVGVGANMPPTIVSFLPLVKT